MGWRSYPLIDESAEPDAFAPHKAAAPVASEAASPVRAAGSPGFTGARAVWDNGDKFEGGFGPTQLLLADYWTLRARSAQLFETNLYARGLIRRLVTNVINTGLFPEVAPEEKVLGVPEQSLSDWSEDVETRFSLWASDAWLCDQSEQNTFGSLQEIAYMEALVAGDVLVVQRQFAPTGLPRIQLIKGASVRTPLNGKPQTPGGRIREGVELDALGRQVAYWVEQDDGTSKRLPAWGEKSGRRLAWLLYASDKRVDDVRGKPLLALILQSLRELDRYRDAALRKAVINACIAGFIEKTAPVAGSMPITGGAVRAGAGMLQADGGDGEPREYAFTEVLPGMYLQELNVGEKPTPMKGDGTDEKLGVFEEAMIQTIAWTNNVPPEILRLSFSSNYSASQAAINEFKMFLNKARTIFGATFCQPIYTEWLLAQSLSGKITAAGLVEAWRDASKYDLFAAWTCTDWAGAIKPAVDMSKLVVGYEKMLAIGAITRARATRELTGMKFSKVMKQRLREDQQLAEVLAPINAVNGVAPTTDPEDEPINDNGEHPNDVEDDAEKE